MRILEMPETSREIDPAATVEVYDLQCQKCGCVVEVNQQETERYSSMDWLGDYSPRFPCPAPGCSGFCTRDVFSSRPWWKFW